MASAAPANAADRIDRALDVGEQVERLLGAPGVPGQGLQWPELDMSGEGRAGEGEDLVEHAAHREDRRPGIDACLADRDLPQLSAGAGGALDDSDGEALARQQQRCDEPAHAGADHRNTTGPHVGVPRKAD